MNLIEIIFNNFYPPVLKALVQVSLLRGASSPLAPIQLDTLERLKSRKADELNLAHPAAAALFPEKHRFNVNSCVTTKNDLV